MPDLPKRGHEGPSRGEMGNSQTRGESPGVGNRGEAELAIFFGAVNNVCWRSEIQLEDVRENLEGSPIILRFGLVGRFWYGKASEIGDKQEGV